MENILREIRNYNWQKLTSDLLVAVIAVTLSFLLERVKQIDTGNLGAGIAGSAGVAVNWIKRYYCV